ncbi:hypothetical protein SAMN04487906_0009 [Zhouia amylolytica]|uniref:Uncharacterized protein n=1 Tax=Zhouia amylolytica TaxID=376730 RepID=A0A1I6NXZ3_9FLAO|nr:hypothetical protein [Zhouia amylolytica]SFS32816.1 hypothetical protein SAMN04487906_0009 [Zhouia amylolytica]
MRDCIPKEVLWVIKTTRLQQGLDEYVSTINFKLCIDNIKSSESELTSDEIKFLKNQFKSLKVEEINKKRIINSENITNIRKQGYYISMPVIFRENNCAIYYSENGTSGQFNLLIKRNNKWECYCPSRVWME